MQPAPTTTLSRPIIAAPNTRRTLAGVAHAPWALRLFLLLALVGALLLGLLPLVPPRVVPSTAPAAQFSAERALESLARDRLTAEVGDSVGSRRRRPRPSCRRRAASLRTRSSRSRRR